MLKCNLCEKSFKYRTSLHRHMNTHYGITQRFTCTVCGKTYGRIDNFKRHFAVHQTAYTKPLTYLPRDQAIIPNLYERPTEATGRILQTPRTGSRRFNIVPANNIPSRRILKIPVVILPHRNRTRFYRGFPGRALPRKFPVFPEWHQKLVTLTQVQKDLYISDDEADTPPTP